MANRARAWGSSRRASGRRRLVASQLPNLARAFEDRQRIARIDPCDNLPRREKRHRDRRSLARMQLFIPEQIHLPVEELISQANLRTNPGSEGRGAATLRGSMERELAFVVVHADLVRLDTIPRGRGECQSPFGTTKTAPGCRVDSTGPSGVRTVISSSPSNTWRNSSPAG